MVSNNTDNSQQLERKLLQTIRKTIAKYSLLDEAGIVHVGFSGGKDSIATVLLLSKAGYTVRPLTVHMGDPLFNVDVAKKTIYGAGFDVEIIDAKSPKSFGQLTKEEYGEVLERFKSLDALPLGKIACAHCYSIKMFALYNVVRSEGRMAIVLGQHREDMITSLLKCYWTDLYYREITKPKGISYQGELMMDLMRSHKELDLDYLRDLVERGRAATDEPFVERNSLPRGIRIVRPLGEVYERDIITYVKSRGVSIAGDFCKFKANLPTKPFRILVHDDYIKRAFNNPEVSERLFELVLMGLTAEGTWKFRPRNTRDKDYPGFKPFIKKL